MGKLKNPGDCRGQKQGIMVSQSWALATEMEINVWFEIYFINKIDRAGKWIKCGEYLREASLWPLVFSFWELDQQSSHFLRYKTIEKYSFYGMA